MYAFYGFCLHNFLLSLMIAEVDEQNAAGEKSIAAPRPTSPSSVARVRRRIPRNCAWLFPYLPLAPASFSSAATGTAPPCRKSTASASPPAVSDQCPGWGNAYQSTGEPTP